MDTKQTLLEFKNKLDQEIELFFDAEIKKEKGRDADMADALKYVKKLILAGGKRLRPAFMYYGYVALGGKELNKILRASISIELIHTFLLIHDDIIDRDNKRHGMDTIAAHYEKINKVLFLNKDAKHFGDSMAIIVGDMLDAMGNQILFESGFDSDLVIKALIRLQEIVKMTVVGEKQDIYIEYHGKAKEEEVISMLELKTARYTIEGPFYLGAILAGAKDDFLNKIEKFAVPIGIAFQIQDDILGVFGNEEKLGKSVGSDIREGKVTVLVVKARESGNREQIKKLNSILGNKELKKRDIEEFRNIIRNTGALEYAKKLALKLVNQGKEEIEKLEMEAESKRFLLGVAEYMINREV